MAAGRIRKGTLTYLRPEMEGLRLHTSGLVDSASRTVTGKGTKVMLQSLLQVQ
jgi:hypothetical protein